MELEQYVKDVYQDLLFTYVSTFNKILRCYTKEEESYWRGYRETNLEIFSKMREILLLNYRSQNNNPIYQYTLFKGKDEYFEEDINVSLQGILTYRDLKFKIYLDDNGQQLCLLLDNNLIGGGTYTSNIEDCGFLYYIDLYLDNKYWNEHKYM